MGLRCHYDRELGNRYWLIETDARNTDVCIMDAGNLIYVTVGGIEIDQFGYRLGGSRMRAAFFGEKGKNSKDLLTNPPNRAIIQPLC